MAKVKIDLNKKVKQIKPMHGVGQPPLAGSKSTHFHFLTEAGIPYSRLHDVGGPYGGNRFVDIPNIFRDFSADENDPASYDFTFTDHLITELVKAGVEPYYRLGITIENDVLIKPYRVFPPEDFGKWARICEHIVAHYNEGWADGFHYNITYWEIWNEPDGGGGKNDLGAQMWRGDPEDFFRLYDITAKHLKKRFPNIKVGGYGACELALILDDVSNPAYAKTDKVWLKQIHDFFHGFFSYIKENGSPIDFFSWHTYKPVDVALKLDENIAKWVREYGFGDIELHLNEWNPYAIEHGSAHHAAEVAAMMLGMQDANTDILCIYDARMQGGTFSALFDGNIAKPFPTYYSLVGFNLLYKLGTQVELLNDTEGLYAVAASDGTRHAVMLANLSGTEQTLDFEGACLKNARIYVTDELRAMSWAPNADSIPNNSVMIIEF